MKTLIASVLSAALLATAVHAQQPVQQAVQPGTPVYVEVGVFTSSPTPGTLPYGKLVAIDDKSCAPGTIKAIVGGSNRQNIPRVDLGCLKLQK